MNQYADDLAELMVHLDVKNATMVGHSTGGGEVVRYIARHGLCTTHADLVNEELLAFLKK